jgi:hypothetical protein
MSSTPRNLGASSVEHGVRILAKPDLTYDAWKKELREAFRASDLDPLAIWKSIPAHIRREFQAFESTVPTASDRVHAVTSSLDLLEKWTVLENKRKDGLPKRGVSRAPTLDLISASTGVQQPRYLTIAPTLSEADASLATQPRIQRASSLLIASTEPSRTVREKAIDFCRKHPVIAIMLLGAFCGWLFSPFGWLPVILLIVLLGKNIYDAAHRRISYGVVLATFAMSSFVTCGIIHDIYFDEHPTAQCGDGTYSYSEHRSGTCSWHGGVYVWNPELHHWWQSLIGAK